MTNEQLGSDPLQELPEHMLDEQALARIGEVVVVFEGMTFQAGLLAMSLMGAYTSLAAIPFVELGLRQLCGVIDSLYVERFGEDEHRMDLAAVLK
jgi:hypothetical protein